MIRPVALFGVGTLLLTGLAHAESVDRDQALKVCFAMPDLQTSEVRRIIDDQLSRPHDPRLDMMTKDQLINAAQWQEGNKCADKLLADPALFRTMARYAFSPDKNMAWDVFSVTCADHLTAQCVDSEVRAYNAVNKYAGTVELRACSLALPEGEFAQVLACIHSVGKLPNSSGDDVPQCTAEKGQQSDGMAAGRVVKECVKQVSGQ